jgi:hypothetical protein
LFEEDGIKYKVLVTLDHPDGVLRKS